jgi:hypothetical protein
MQANQVKKERKPMTPEQIEALKARLMKAREAKIERDKKRYEYNKEEVKTEAIKKRALTKVKKLVDAGTLKEEELQKVLPVNQEVKQVVKEVGSSSLEKKVADVIPGSLSHEAPRKLGDTPFEEPALPCGSSEARSAPLPQPKKNKDKDRFLKIVYYKEPSKAALKKLQKIQESSSDDESSDEEHANTQNVNQTTTEDDYYRSLARQFFN